MDSTLLSTRTINSGSLKVDSVHDYLTYSKKMQLRLAEINNNVSSVIQESCSGIDNICNRVRQCLIDMDERAKLSSRRNKPPPESLEPYDEVKDVEEDISQDIDITSEDTSLSLEVAEQNEEEGQNGEAGQSVNTMASGDILKIVDTESSDDTSQSTSNSLHVEEKDVEEIPIDEEEPSNHKQILNKTIYSMKNQEDSESVLQEMEHVGETHYKNFKKTISTLCNNFEMMNQLVESINKDITEFSETAIPKTEEDKNDIKKDNYVKNKVKPTRSTSKGRSQSETELDVMDLIRHDHPFLIPDVYRKKAFTNLYDKLRAQVEASDSLMIFKTLMQRQKKVGNGNISLSKCKLNIPFLNYSLKAKLDVASKTSESAQPPAKQNLRDKYAGSLWFSPKQILKDKSSTSTCKKTTKRNSKRNNAASASIIKNSSNQIKNIPKTNSTKSCVQAKIEPSQFSSVETVTEKECALGCPCKLVVKNERPAPCRGNKCQLQWLKAKPVAHQRRLKFIDMLDDLTHKDLLPLQSEYPRKDNERGRELDYKNIKETYLYKLMYGVQGTRNAWQHLFEPAVVAKNSRLGRARPSSYKPMGTNKDEKTSVGKICKQNCSKTEILKKLSPYIYHTENPAENYSKTIIVMPVQVHYENFRNNEPPTRLLSPGRTIFCNLKRGSASPSREARSFRSTSFSHKTPKSMKVVFDGIQNKLELPPITATKQSPVTSSVRHYVERTASKSLSPKSFISYCSDLKTYRKGPPEVRYEQNVAIYNKIQADIETIKSEIYGKKCNKVDRKLWAHKYGKSVGQNLVTFVRNQKPQEFEIPKFALPKLQDRTDLKTPKDDSYPSRDLCFQKQIIHINDKLRSKGEVIQTNIKKAIDVIEGRMVDILCNNSDSVEAFNIMEKEITNILDMMKSQGKANDPKENKDQKPKDDLEEKYQVISDNLFERLEKILTSECSNSDISKKEVVEKPKKEEAQKKQKVSPYVEQLEKVKELKKKHKNMFSAEEPKKENDELKKRPKTWSSKRSRVDNPTSLDEKRDKKCASRGSKKETRPDSKRKYGHGKPAIAQIKEIVEPIPEKNIIHNDLQQVTKDEMVAVVSIEENATAGSKPSEVTMDEIATSQDIALMERMDPSSTLTIENAAREDKVEKLEKLEPETILSCYNVYKSKLLSKIDDIVNTEFNEVKDAILDKELQTVQNDEPQEVLIEQLHAVDNFCNTDEENDQNKNDALFVHNEKLEHNKSEMENANDAIKPPDKEICMLYIEKEEFTKTESSNVIEKTVKRQEEAGDKNAQPVQEFTEAESSNVTEKTGGNENAQPVQAFTKAENSNVIEETAKPVQDNRMPKVIDSSSPETSDNENISHRLDEYDYSQNMHRIIKRVEDIYYRLDDLHDSESSQHIPVFKDVTVPEVPSEDFLTPFMQVVKETREISKTNKELLLEKSPSYYNIMNFLDALSNIQQEVVSEVYTVRMYNYPLRCRQATVYDHSVTWEQAKYSNGNYKTGCLKKSVEDARQNKHKKVSFLDIMKDQSSQATLCPYHKIKVVKISSQQFPPTKKGNDTSEQSLGLINDYEGSLIHIDTKPGVTNFDKMETDPSNLDLSYINNPKGSNEEQIHSSQQNDCGTDGKRNSPVDKVMEPCEVHVNIPCISHWVGGPEMKTEPELSVEGDKSTQVFCHMQSQTDINSSEENVCLSSEEQPLDSLKCELSDPDESKSIEHDSYDSQMDPLFDYSNESVTRSGVMQKVEEVYDENSKLASSGQAPPKVVVFREVIEKQKILPLKSTIDKIETYKKKLEKRKEARLLRKQGVEVLKKHAVPEDRENVVLLKSFYAIVYILMFSALSLDYRCL